MNGKRMTAWTFSVIAMVVAVIVGIVSIEKNSPHLMRIAECCSIVSAVAGLVLGFFFKPILLQKQIGSTVVPSKGPAILQSPRPSLHSRPAYTLATSAVESAATEFPSPVRRARPAFSAPSAGN